MDLVKIRKYKQEDIAGFYEAVAESKNEVSKWLPWCDNNYTIKDTKKWIEKLVPEIWESKRGCEFVITNPVENKIIGGCCLERIDIKHKEASIGYWIRTSETKKGIATKACHFLLNYGFESLHLNCIKIIPSVKNIASVKVAEKLPYQKIKKIEKGFQIRDDISDALIYTVTRKSYIKNK